MAEEAILRETVRAAARASIAGPSGWRKRPTNLTLNKNFLSNTIKDAVSSNRRKDETLNSKSYSRKKYYEEKLRDKCRRKNLSHSSRDLSHHHSDNSHKRKKCESSYEGERNSAMIYKKKQKTEKIVCDSDINSCDSDIIELNEDGSEKKSYKRKNQANKYLEWSEEEGLVMKPITKEHKKSKRMEESINRVRNKIRSRKFISEQHDTRKWEKTNPHREIQFRSQATSVKSKNGISFVPEDVATMSDSEQISKWTNFVPNGHKIQNISKDLSDKSRNVEEIQFISESKAFVNNSPEQIAKWTKAVPNSHKIQFVPDFEISS